jgi:hypothetical protein
VHDMCILNKPALHTQSSLLWCPVFAWSNRTGVVVRWQCYKGMSEQIRGVNGYCWHPNNHAHPRMHSGPAEEWPTGNNASWINWTDPAGYLRRSGLDQSSGQPVPADSVLPEDLENAQRSISSWHRHSRGA